jgi:hypothetical protein
MKSDIQFLPLNIPESNLDSAVVSKLNSSGTGNANIVIVTAEADIYNSANADKILEFQTDITLTANRTLASGVTLKWGGGKLILDGFTLTGNLTKIDAPVDEVLIDAFTGEVNGTWASIIHSIVNFGARNIDTDTTDNVMALYSATYVRNQSSGTLYWNEGNYYCSVTDVTGANTYQLYLKDSNNITWYGENCNLKLISHGLTSTNFVRVQYTKGSKIEGINFFGDEGENPGQPSTKGEFNHAIVLSTLCYDFSMKNVNITDGFYADGIIANGDSQFMNYIKDDGTGDSDVAVGYYDSSGVLDAGNTDYTYSDTLLPLTGTQFDNSKYHGGNGFYFVTGGSFAGWSGLLSPNFWALYYDDLGNFIEKSPMLDTYSKIQITNPNWKQIRIMFYKPFSVDWIQIRPDLVADGFHAENVNIHYVGRNGASNLPLNTVWKDSEITNCGGVPAGPGSGIDIEDYRRLAQNYHLENITFRNNWSDIDLIGPDGVKIVNCKFLQNTKDLSASPTNPPHTALNVAWGRNVIVEGSEIEFKRVILDRGDLFVNNRMNGGQLNYTANANVVKNNEFLNTILYSTYNVLFSDRAGYPTIIESNNFRYNVMGESGSYWFKDENNAGLFRNNLFNFSDVYYFSGSATPEVDGIMTSNDSKLGTTVNRLWLVQTASTEDLGGYWENNEFKGILPPLSSRDYSAGNNTFPLTNWKGGEYSLPMIYYTNFVKDFIVKDVTWNGWTTMNLGNNWEDTIISATPTIRFENCTNNIGDEYNWTNTDSYIFWTKAKNVSYEFVNHTFNLTKSCTPNASGNRFLQFEHLGTTLLDNCTFKSVSNITLDFTNTSIFPANLGDVTIIDPKTTNVSFTLRAGDKILCTYPSIHAPSYVDNTTALAALGEGYYYKDTTTGKFEVTIS